MTAAAMLFLSGDQMLLVERTWSTALVLPGGVVEPGESPVQAAEREVREELGLSVRPGRLLVHDTRPGMDHHVFSGGPLPDPALLLPDLGGEVAAVHVLPVEEAIARHVARGRWRIRAAVDAQRAP